jgi:MFS family permease
MIGATIGLAFAVSLVAAPALYRSIGMGGLFVLTGLLSLAAIWVVLGLVPDVPSHVHAAPGSAGLAAAFHPELLRLNLGIFVLHLVQMAMFVVLPTLLVESGLTLPEHWKFYLPVVLLSFTLMAPAVFQADRRDRAKAIMLGAIALLAGTLALFALGGAGLWQLAILALGFFAAFNVLEAIIPSLVTRVAPPRSRGAAIGVYNTTQTLGLFVGGFAGGWLAGRWGSSGVFAACAALAVIWLAVALRMSAQAASRVNEAGAVALGDHRHS